MAAIFLECESLPAAVMLYIGSNCFLRTCEMLGAQLWHLLPHHIKREVAVVIPFSKASIMGMLRSC